MKEIILASASPRRIEIFRKNGIDIELMPADVDETLPKGIKAADAVMFLALKKALHTEKRILKEKSEYKEKNPLIVAADTVVFKDSILGKPDSEENAFEMLSSLRNGNHFVATGVAIIEAGGAFRKVFYDTTEVIFKDYSDDEIREYIATGEPMDKAGAYAIQGEFRKYVKEFRGSYENVVGFPWERFADEMTEYECKNEK